MLWSGSTLSVPKDHIQSSRKETVWVKPVTESSLILCQECIGADCLELTSYAFWNVMTLSPGGIYVCGPAIKVLVQGLCINMERSPSTDNRTAAIGYLPYCPDFKHAHGNCAIWAKYFRNKISYKLHLVKELPPIMATYLPLGIVLACIVGISTGWGLFFREPLEVSMYCFVPSLVGKLNIGQPALVL